MKISKEFLDVMTKNHFDLVDMYYFENGRFYKEQTRIWERIHRLCQEIDDIMKHLGKLKPVGHKIMWPKRTYWRDETYETLHMMRKNVLFAEDLITLTKGIEFETTFGAKLKFTL